MRLVGTILMALGVILLFGTGLLLAQGEYERVQVEAHLAAIAEKDAAVAATATAAASTAALAAPPAITPTATARPDIAASPTKSAASALTAEATPTAPPPTARPQSTPTPLPALVRRIIAPAISLDAGVVEAPLRNGEWDVPKFVAGHLEGTALPGQERNVVLSGHVQSISSGNVFAQLADLKPRDPVTLKTTAGDFLYTVREIKIVPNNDVSVIRPTSSEVLTLITCTGTFDPIRQDYSHRTIVIADREPAPRS